MLTTDEISQPDKDYDDLFEKLVKEKFIQEPLFLKKYPKHGKYKVLFKYGLTIAKIMYDVFKGGKQPTCSVQEFVSYYADFHFFKHPDCMGERLTNYDYDHCG